MRFSMIFEAQLASPTPDRERQLLRDCVEQAVAAEAAGFDGVWAVEHHSLTRYSHMSAPEIFLAAVAARTSRIRIGHGAVCMPFNFNYPTRVAERIAMLDVLSGGRLDVGAARGATAQEAALANVDPERTYAEIEEALRIIGRAWQEETFEWHGALLDIAAPEGNERHTILPRPVQRPHPPLFLACTKPDTVRRAASYGVGALIFGFAGLDSVRLQKRMHAETVATRTGEEFVSSVVNDSFIALAPTIVLDDAAEARRVGARGQRFFGESIGYWGGRRPTPAGDHTHDDDNIAYMRRLAAEMTARYDRGELPMVKDRSLAAANFNIDHAYGDAETAIDYVRELEAAGVDEVMCLIQMGTVEQEICLETIRQWGENVIPRFRAPGTADPSARPGIRAAQEALAATASATASASAPVVSA
ncbi:LLM class flavin-dependent oxidoreductase [Frankia sp. R43]|uniref:LLM class flavin-dependent oxidoreductase n=1 Tax=Frankia sp. R43 TaxID=269536 RepID=UPI0007C75124|nr:LLM class flavin-dependent oxidoreductase [Frankia sp. R43]